MRRNKWMTAAALAAAVTMTAAACGSDDEAGGDTSSAAATTAADTGAADTGAGEDTAAASSEDTAGSEDTAASEDTAGSEDTAAASSEDTAAGGGGTADSSASGGGSGEALKFGYILPESGDLAYLGPPQIQGMKYAMSLINEAGGVLGSELPDPVSGDEANDQALAAQAADREIADGVNVIIGAAATGMTMAIIDKVTGAGIAQCSGSNTGVILTDYKDNDLYFRTAPSDALQGPVLGDTIVADGYSNVAILARGDDYGKGLAQATQDSLEAAGATVAMNETYDPKTTDFSATIQKVVAAKPDAVVLVSFEEGFQLLKGLIQAGITPAKVGVYGADGMRSATAGTDNFASDPGVLSGMKGTAPASADNPEFMKGLKEFAPDLKETQYAPQVFDCTTIMALAAEQAGSTDAETFKAEVNAVTKEGTECKTFADCKKLIDEGTDIHYVGAAGDLAFTDAGEPGTATIEIYGYNDKGELETLGTEQSNPAN